MKSAIKILSLFLSLSMLLSFGSVVAFADDYTSGGGIGSFGDYFAAVLGQFGRDFSGTSTFGSVFGFLAKGIAGSICGDVCSLSDDGLHHCSYVSPGIESHRDSHGWYATLPCDYCGKKFNAYSKDFDDSYQAFNDDIPLNGYGSDGGFYWYPSFSDAKRFMFNFRNKSMILAVGFIDGLFCDYNQYGYLSGSCDYSDSRLFGSVSITNGGNITSYYLDYSFSAPIAGSYSLVPVLGVVTNCGVGYYDSRDCGYRNVGYNFVFNFQFSRDVDVSLLTFSCYLPVFKVVPTQDISNNYYVYSSRIGSVNFNLATKQGDTVTNVYQNVQIVNEETNTYTDVVTGQQQNIKSWTYDYTTRTYHLTLEDGSLLDVTFGDDSIQVKLNGELTQEYYYTVGNETEPTPTPDPSVTPDPDLPTPTPTPGPGGDGGDDDQSFFDWLKQWLIDFKTWLGEKFDALGVGDAPPGDTNIDIAGDTYNDVDIHYTDQDGEEKDTSLFDLAHKFDFLRDIYDIGRTMFSMVSADAAAAYAYDPDQPMTISADDGIMPIANGAPSLKMNLGAAQSHYGWNYGGEIEILDLSWYTPYKETVDGIISGFLWLLFVWGLFKQAPSIISGGGIVANKAEDISEGKKGR